MPMFWLMWRRYRPQLIVLASLLVLGGLVLPLLTSLVAEDFRTLHLDQCAGQAQYIGPCVQRVQAFSATWNFWLEAARIGLLTLPVLLGMFLGAPLVARELEQGTHVLGFTQSISRTRWLLTRLAVILLPSLLLTVAAQWLVLRFLLAAGDDRGPYYWTRFGISDLAPASYTLFAILLGTFAGALLRRTLPAMVVSLTATVAARVTLDALHPFLLPRRRLVTELGGWPADGSLMTGVRGYLDAQGQVLPQEAVTALHDCRQAAPSTDQWACWHEHGAVHGFVDVIPVAEAGTLHLVEASIFAGLAVLLFLGTIGLLRRKV
ncbi:ABC transporter permease [Pseudonocardiaceae bacterium YIM PH 21723]|nr:ABC transporter permease [Pseudonocardiaceae bacterium YIM PH 21723]